MQHNTHMPKKKLSDIVFHRVSPPDTKADVSVDDLAAVLVRRLGLKRKESRSNHGRLLLELLKYRRDSVPIDIQKISSILQVSQSQAYEELRKWRTLGLIEFVKIPSQGGFIKGYMMPATTTNRLLDRVESSLKSFMRKTRRIAKDFDDLLMLDAARASKEEKPKESPIVAPAAVPVKKQLIGDDEDDVPEEPQDDYGDDEDGSEDEGDDETIADEGHADDTVPKGVGG